MADQKSLPQIKKEVDELTQRMKSPQPASIEEREKERQETTAQALSLSAQMQSMLSRAEYSHTAGSFGAGQAGLMATAQKLAQVESSASQWSGGGSGGGSPLAQMMRGYQQRSEARRQGGIGGMDPGSGGGSGRYSGGDRSGVPGVPGSSRGGGGDFGGGGAYSGESYGSLKQQREAFRKELDANPALRQKIMTIAANENNDPRAQQAIMETMMNRAAMRGKSLASEATWVTEHPGYYDDRKGRHRGIAAYNNEQTRAGLNSRLESALGGSNVSKWGTGNASGSFVEGRINKGMYSRTVQYGGESFVTEGGNQYTKWRQGVGKDKPTGGGQQQGGREYTGPGQARPETPTQPTGGRFTPKNEGKEWGQERFQDRTGGGNKTLMAAQREASKYLPDGFSIEALSGDRPGTGPGSKGFHGIGQAVDFQIYEKGTDGQTRKVDWYQSPQGYKVYEQNAYDVHKALHDMDPELAKRHSWGGYFGGEIAQGHTYYAGGRGISGGKYGAMDLMHHSLGPGRGRYREGGTEGTFETGASAGAQRRWGIETAGGMGEDISKYHAFKGRAGTEGTTAAPEHRQQWPGEKEYKGPQKSLDAEPAQEHQQEAPQHGQRESTEKTFGGPQTSTLKTQMTDARGRQSSGSAFSIGGDYYMTAAHTLSRDASIDLIMGRTKSDAELVHKNRSLDYAILKSSGEGTSRLQQAGMTDIGLSRDAVKEGTRLTAQGYSGPTGRYTTASGKFAGAEDFRMTYDNQESEIRNAMRIETEESMGYLRQKMPGTSGGPVTDEEGKAVGLVSGHGAPEMGGEQRGGPSMFSPRMEQIIKDLPASVRESIPQLREKLHAEMKEKMEKEAPQTAAPQEGGRRTWPGERPGATAEAAKNLPLTPAPERAKEAISSPEAPRGQPSAKAADGTPSPQAQRAKEQARGSRMHIPGKSLSNVNPELRSRIEAMYKAAPASAKAGFYVISGRRDTALQAKLYARYKAGKGGIAAAPGHSKHEIGMAADIRDPSGWFHKHAGEYGLGFPMGKRDWPHMQMMGSPQRHIEPTSYQDDKKTHEVKKSALKEQGRTQHQEAQKKPERPQQQQRTHQPNFHHPHQERQGKGWANHHAQPSVAGHSRVHETYHRRGEGHNSHMARGDPNQG